jgi:hypothetical protein
MSKINQQCQVNGRLDLRIEDLGYLQELLNEQDSSSASCFFNTSLSETLKFVRVDGGLWFNEDYNITIRVPV